MKRIESALFTCILPVVAVLIVSFGYAQASNSKLNPTMNMCKHQYALCTSALCVPQPGDPTKAICFCDVEEGPSLSSVPCNTSAPSTDANGVRTVYSAYSPLQFKGGRKGMICPSGTPWSWCLNKRCTIDPMNPKKAICTCDVVRSPGKWMTLGGDCNTDTCKTGYWSGATLEDINSGTEFLMKSLNITKSPLKWCPNSQ